MPTYQYACTECGHSFDIVQSFSEDSLTVCPECEGRLRKVFNAVGVVFKGSGFYRTDSRGKDTSSGEVGSSSSTSETPKKPSDDGAAAKKSESTKSDSPKTDSGSSTKKSESSKA